MGNCIDCNDATVATIEPPHKVSLAELQERFNIKNSQPANYKQYEDIYKSYPETFNFSLFQKEDYTYTLRLYTRNYSGRTSAYCLDEPTTIQEYCSTKVNLEPEKMRNAILGLSKEQYDFFFGLGANATTRVE
jgi:hypothetical protein